MPNDTCSFISFNCCFNWFISSFATLLSFVMLFTLSNLAESKIRRKDIDMSRLKDLPILLLKDESRDEPHLTDKKSQKKDISFISFHFDTSIFLKQASEDMNKRNIFFPTLLIYLSNLARRGFHP